MKLHDYFGICGTIMCFISAREYVFYKAQAYSDWVIISCHFGFALIGLYFMYKANKEINLSIDSLKHEIGILSHKNRNKLD